MEVLSTREVMPPNGLSLEHGGKGSGHRLDSDSFIDKIAMYKLTCDRVYAGLWPKFG